MEPFGLSQKCTDSSLLEEFEVPVARDAGRPNIILNDEHGDGDVLGNDHWPDNAGLGEHHMVTFGPYATKTGGLEHPGELLIRNGPKL